MTPDEIVNRSPQSQECLGRGKALEMPHNLVSLPYVFVVAFDWIVVVLQPILPASYRDPVHELRNPVEVDVECALDLP